MGSVGGLAFSAICVYKNDPKFYSNLFMPTMAKILDAEQAHKVAVWALSKKLFPAQNPLQNAQIDMVSSEYSLCHISQFY